MLEYLTITFILFASLSIKAQDVNKATSLSAIIDTLEIRYNITFTYADATIKDVRIKWSFEHSQYAIR